jgi:hypothetical protein
MVDAKDFANYDVVKQLDYNDIYSKDITKVEALALAIVAQKINGEYVKRGGLSDFVETYDEEADDVVQRFMKTKESNRVVMELVQQFDRKVLTEEVLQEAQDMIQGLEMDYMFKVLGDSMNDFEKSIQDFLGCKEFHLRQHVGVIAYIPAYVEREAEQRDLADRSIGSEYLGDVGDHVSCEIAIVSHRQATAWAGYNVNAITKDGNRVSFFTGKEHIAKKKGTFEICAKVKDHGRVWKDESIKETRLNYVKIM